jgi:multiple sugar transport system permease protein
MFTEVGPPAIVIDGPLPAARPGARPAARRVLTGATPYLYVLPALAGLGLWVYWPLIQTFRLSLVQWNLLPTAPQVGVGLANYRQILRLPQLQAALGTTGWYMLGLLGFGVLLPLLIGVAAQGVPRRSQSFYRAVLFVPVLISPIAAAAVWSFLLAPNGGAVNSVLGLAGVAPRNWLFDPSTAVGSLVTIAGWKILGASVLIVMAGLAAIGPEYHQAASLDGAGPVRRLIEITVPLLSPTLAFLLASAVLLAAGQIMFPLVDALTAGGPDGATTDAYYLLYSFGFTSFDVGLASAAAVLFFLAFAVVTVPVLALLDRLSRYQG